MNSNPPPPHKIGNGLGLPKNGSPKIIPMLVDLTVQPSWTVDLTQQQQSNAIGPIQTIYINNSGNGSSVTVEALVSNISYTIQAGDSAILPFFLPQQAPKFTVTSNGGVVVPIAVLDTPQPAQVWGTSGNFKFTGSGYLEVSDVALDALIANLGGGNALNVNVLTGGGGGGPAESQSLLAALISANSGAGVAFGLPPAGQFVHITGIELSISNDAAIAGGAASANFNINYNGAPFPLVMTTQVFVPQAAPINTPVGSTVLSRIFDASGLGPNPTVSDNCFYNWTGPTLTSGKFSLNVFGYFHA